MPNDRRRTKLQYAQRCGINRDGGTLDYCAEEGITVQCWSPLMYGFFEGNFIDSPEFPELNQKLAELGEKYSATKAAIAPSEAYASAVQCAADSRLDVLERVRDISRAGDITLTREEWMSCIVPLASVCLRHRMTTGMNGLSVFIPDDAEAELPLICALGEDVSGINAIAGFMDCRAVIVALPVDDCTPKIYALARAAFAQRQAILR